MIEADLFGGTILEFPDGTADEVINRTAKRETARARAKVPRPPEVSTFDVKMLDGMVIRGVPDGTPKEEIRQKWVGLITKRNRVAYD